jgi:hypothetical protein
MEKMNYLVGDLRKKCANLQASIADAQQARKSVPDTVDKATQVETEEKAAQVGGRNRGESNTGGDR